MELKSGEGFHEFSVDQSGFELIEKGVLSIMDSINGNDVFISSFLFVEFVDLVDLLLTVITTGSSITIVLEILFEACENNRLILLHDFLDHH